MINRTDRIVEEQQQAELLVAPRSPWHSSPLFPSGSALLVGDGGLSQTQKQQLDLDGHVVLPGVLTPETVERTVSALARIDELEADFERTAMGRWLPSTTSTSSPSSATLRCWRWRDLCSVTSCDSTTSARAHVATPATQAWATTHTTTQTNNLKSVTSECSST
jgi:hypothetical protein